MADSARVAGRPAAPERRHGDALAEAAAGAAVLTLYGMAPLVWSNAVVTEVYALASLCCGARSMRRSARGPNRQQAAGGPGGLPRPGCCWAWV